MYKFRASLVNRLILYYTAISVALILLLSAFFYIVSEKSLRNEIIKADIENMQKTARLIDYMLLQIENNTVQISSDNGVNRFLNGDFNFKDAVKGEQIDSINSLYGVLQNFMGANAMIDQVLVFNYTQNYIVASNGHASHIDEFNDEVWSGCLTNTEYYDKWFVAGNENKYLVFMKPLPLNYLSRTGVLAVRVPAENIGGILVSDKENNNSGTYILGDNSVSLFKPYADLPKELLIHEFSNRNSFVKKLEDKSYLITKIISEYTGWQYVSLTPTKSIMSGIVVVNTIIPVICFIFILVCWLVVRRVSKKIYSPIGQIVEKISVVSKNSDDDLGLISNTINYLETKNSDLEQILKSNDDTIKKNFVQGLLAGYRYTEQQLEQKLSYCNVQFPFEYFAVIVFGIDNAGAYFDSADDNEKKLTIYGIINITEELVSKYFTRSLLADVENHCFAVILNLKSEEDIWTLISGFVAELRRELEGYLKQTVSVGISNTVHKIEGILEGYSQASKALSMRMIMGHNTVTKFSEIHKESGAEIIFETAKLVNAIKAEDLTFISVEVERFLSEIRGKGIYELERIYAIFMHIIREIQNEFIDLGDEIEDSRNLYKQLLRFDCLDDIGGWLKKFFEGIAAAVQNNSNKGKKRSQLALEYIINNFKRDISQEDVAQYMNVSTSYLSSIFKDELNTSFTNCLNKVRIDEAIRLLKENNDILVNDLAVMCGFNSIHTFMRAFKRFEGVTPGKYKELL